MTLQPYGPGIINLKVPRQGEGVCDKNTVVQRLEGGVDINIYCLEAIYGMTTEQRVVIYRERPITAGSFKAQPPISSWT